jgi:hypothetical protein
MIYDLIRQQLSKTVPFARAAKSCLQAEATVSESGGSNE